MFQCLSLYGTYGEVEMSTEETTDETDLLFLPRPVHGSD